MVMEGGADNSEDDVQEENSQSYDIESSNISNNDVGNDENWDVSPNDGHATENGTHTTLSAASGVSDNDEQITKEGKKGCHLRWSRISKAVEVREASGGLIRTSIARPAPESSKDHKKAASGGPTMKVILNEVSGSARPGEILSVMGPSGSGKTSLLDALSGRIAFDSGVMTINGMEETASAMKQLKRKIAYIKQQDVFFGHLTVRDQLTYTALLRLPSTWSKVRKHAEVNRIIDLLRLNKCADTAIKLVSGGEKKRVNIGSELLTDPSVIMLDEPTSGLDSTSASALLSMLINLAQNDGKTVVTSIHQPSSAVFRSFNRILLLADGFVVYYGAPAASLSYLEGHHYGCPAGYNLADHWMDLLVEDSALEGGTVHERVDYHEKKDDDSPRSSLLGTEDTDSPSSPQQAEPVRDEENHIARRGSSFRRRKSMQRRNSTARLLQQTRIEAVKKRTPKARLIDLWDNELFSNVIDDENRELASTASAEAGNTSADERRFNTSWLTQFSILTHRSLKNSRSAIFTPLNLIKSGSLGLMTGLLWFQMPYTEETVLDRSAYFFFTMTYWVFDAMFQALFSFPAERKVIFKERASGSYHLSAYFLAKSISEVPTRLALPSIYMTISYWLGGLNPRFVVFLGSTCCTLLSVLAGESIGLVVGAHSMEFEKAMVIMLVFSLTLMLAGGFYVDNIPSFLIWLQYISPFKYAYDASQQLVFDRNVPCDGSGVLEVICAGNERGYATPGEVIKFLDVQGSVAFNVGLMAVLFAVPRYLAFLVLKRTKGAERS